MFLVPQHPNLNALIRSFTNPVSPDCRKWSNAREALSKGPVTTPIARSTAAAKVYVEEQVIAQVVTATVALQAISAL